MSDLTSENEVTIAATVLRTSLSETERLLNKYTESLRRHLVSEANKSKVDMQAIAIMIDLLNKMQGDFIKFKSGMDIISAFFAK